MHMCAQFNKMASTSNVLDTKHAVTTTKDDDATNISSSSLSKEDTDATPIKQTVVRLKRRIEDSPSKILVISYSKRSKTESAENSDVAAGDTPVPSGSTTNNSTSNSGCSKILRLVGTVPEEEINRFNITATVKNVIQSDASANGACGGSGDGILRQNIKAKRKTKITEKARENFKPNSEDSRFKMIASKRGIAGSNENEESEENDIFKLLDLVPESDIKEPRKKIKPDGFEAGNVTCNGQPMVRDASEDGKGFVYDLYISHDPYIEEFICDQFLSVEPGEDNLHFGEMREVNEEDEHFMEDDDDSNAEDNWRNDYPDSDDGLDEEKYVYEAAGDNSDDDVYQRFKVMGVHGESSSDDDLVYGIDDDNDGMGFEKKYSRYKQRVMQEYADEVVSISSQSDYD